MRNFKNKFTKVLCLAVCAMLGVVSAYAQNVTVRGSVVDENGEPIVGATVVVKGTTNATMSDFDGNFSLSVPTGSTLSVTYIGYSTSEVTSFSANTPLKVTLVDEMKELNEVVVVGYGQQKKASIVGAITQTTGEVLERAAGISDVGAALTGNLPGVVTVQGNGQPGEEEPQITIRGAASWNNDAGPLVLVDGIERPMSSVDIASVASMSVLKDASATAVYGVKGANGVILITTKRGAEGKAHIEVNLNATMKTPSKLPGKYDSYDALMYRNQAVEHELACAPTAWDYIRPQQFINNYRNQTTLEQKERYANVDWQDALFKDYAMSYNANVNIMGGTKFVRYYASADYVNEGDLFRIWDNGRGYESGYGYNRVSVRSNLDFHLTDYTVFKVNISGTTGFRKAPANNQGDAWQEQQRWAGAYNIAPDVFLPQYSDGAWGEYRLVSNVSNSAQNVAIGGSNTTTTSRINTDFILEQDLSFLTEGLNVRGTISWDNNFRESGRGIGDAYNSPQSKRIDPVTGEEFLANSITQNDKFDWKENIQWSSQAGQADGWATSRNVYYQLQANWNRQFGLNNVGLMGVFSRNENASGSEIPRMREDWAFRATYNYADRYFLEYNGAYNGSEKFSSANRFAFFNSGALGWMISEEQFFAPLKSVVDMLKVRYSLGEIGNDNIGSRWLYMDTWATGDQTAMDGEQQNSNYTWYYQSALGNPDVKWETVRKQNIGIDYSFLGGLLAGNVEFFRDDRRDILIPGTDRAVPNYFGASAPVFNAGKTKTQGYEIELRVNKTFKNGIRAWANMNMTHSRNEIVFKDDKELTPNYQKQEGYSINQAHSYLDAGTLNTFDQLLGAPAHENNNNMRLPGDYYIIDFNGDGIVDSKDSAPVAFSGIPENTYNATLGAEWNGLSAFVQFYGVTNVTREVTMSSFGSKLNTVFDQGEWWSKDSNGDVPVSRFESTPNGVSNGTRYLYDGSYIRLKNAEVAYTWTKGWINAIGVKSLKVFVSGNNLWLWTRMPDDRESNLGGYSGGGGAYPTVKRYNFGLKFSL